MARVRHLTGAHLEFWRERHLCTVTTLRRDGSPHVVPMGIVLDPEHGLAWGITSGTSQKVATLSPRPRPRGRPGGGGAPGRGPPREPCRGRRRGPRRGAVGRGGGAPLRRALPPA